MLIINIVWLFVEVFFKIIFPVQKNVVSLQPFSPKGVSKTTPRKEYIETVETNEIACVRHRTRCDGTRTSLGKTIKNNSYNEEFDPGSGWTLAAGLTHASRGAALGSNTLAATGGRVRNAYATCLGQGDKPGKLGLIPNIVARSHGLATKASVVRDGHAWH